MKYDENEKLCREAWEEDYNDVYIDRSKKRDERRYCYCNESKNTFIECFLININVVFN